MTLPNDTPLAQPPTSIVAALFDTANESLRPATRPHRRLQSNRTRGHTMKPGADTPLWNELVKQLQPHLRKRGEKARLARLLGLPRQRVHQLLRARTACADAERTLLLLCWLAAKAEGRELAG